MTEIEELLAAIERKRKHGLLLTGVAVLAAVVFLLATIGQVAEGRRELKFLDRRIEERRKELDFLGKALWNTPHQTAREAINKAVDAEPSLAMSAGRVYLHIRDDQQRPRARQMGQACATWGTSCRGLSAWRTARRRTSSVTSVPATARRPNGWPKLSAWRRCTRAALRIRRGRGTLRCGWRRRPSDQRWARSRFCRASSRPGFNSRARRNSAIAAAFFPCNASAFPRLLRASAQSGRRRSTS